MCDYLKNEDLDTPRGELTDNILGDRAIESACSEDEQVIQEVRKNLSDILGKKVS